MKGGSTKLDKAKDDDMTLETPTFKASKPPAEGKTGKAKFDTKNPYGDTALETPAFMTDKGSGGSRRVRHMDDYDGKPSKVTVGGPKPKRQFDPNPYKDKAEVGKPGRKVRHMDDFDGNPSNVTIGGPKPKRGV
jgi:hypothetical protein